MNKEQEEAVAEMERAIRALGFEVPASVWNDINARWRAVKATIS
jgi:hypothetical protein